VITFIVGLFIALTAKNPKKLACVTAYICGAEILWRMTEASIFWEFGKYAIVALMGISLLRMRGVKSAGLPILFFFLLSVSIPLTITGGNLEDARQAISFNLSGPLCLAVCVIFFYQVRLSWEDRENLIWYLVVPIMGIATLCLRGIITAEELNFVNESNFATSGGFGPNQISAILGLGALMLFLLTLQVRKNSKRWIPLGLGLGLLAISVLTFSRGGLYNVGAALLVTGVLSLGNPRVRAIFLPVTIVAILVGGYVIFPQLNKFTGNALEERFTDTDTTGRTEILLAEINVWKQHPIFGVGPGMGPIFTHQELGGTYAAHTEYTRILAEHGVFGILSILILFLIGMRAFIKAPSGLPQAWMAALLVWPLVEMTHAAMRVAAIGFIFGLAVALWPFLKVPAVQN
jgi:O-antigen ligase